jgi:hypothetical protein
MGLSSYTEWLASLPEEERKILEKENAEFETMLAEEGITDNNGNRVMPFTVQSMVANATEEHKLKVEYTSDTLRTEKRKDTDTDL